MRREIEFYIDFHDVLVNAREAWLHALAVLLSPSSLEVAYQDYANGLSRHSIAQKYGFSFDEWETCYRETLTPVQENVALAASIAMHHRVSILSLAPGRRVTADLHKCGIDTAFAQIIAKEQLAGMTKHEFLLQRSRECDWCVFITHETEHFSVEQNIITIPTAPHNGVKEINGSFDEHARRKKLYHELSPYYLLSICNDTGAEVGFLELLAGIYGLPPKADVLDCCCGVGRHALALWKKGYHVTGVDFSEEQIANARRLNKDTGNRFLVMDVRHMELAPHRYPLAICMWTTYNYLSEESELATFVGSVANYQKSGDILVLDAKNIPALPEKRSYMRETCAPERNIWVDLIVRKTILERKFQCSHYYYLINDGAEKYAFHDDEYVRFYNLQELGQIVSPWYSVDATFGDFDLSLYAETSSTRLIAVLKRL